jgi:beta-phosphoglucomutase-like phosphatase (HAD superfamily)
MSTISIAENIKALIFDCDGTLANSMPIHNQSWHAILAQYGLECDQNFFNPLSGMPTKKIVNLLNKTYNYQLDVDSFAKQRDAHILSNLVNISPITPVVNIVKQYYGKLPMCVASGGDKKNVIATLEAINVLNFFDTVITADDPVKPKPAPDIFLYAAEQMKVEPEFCQVFEDGELGLIGAKEAGMVVTDVRPWVKEWLQTTHP